MTRTWLDRVHASGMKVLLSALLAFGPAAWASRLSAADATMPTPAVEASQERLHELLAGVASPATVEDLRLIQQRVQQLTEKLISSTVGVQVGPAWGSGVIISKDGYVLTAAHVCGRPEQDVRFMLSDGRVVKGKTLGLYRTLDAGLMKITEQGEYPAVEMGASDALKDRQWCLATGHPGGYQDDRKPVLRMGRVLFSNNGAITTDCTLVGGDSGGPLFDLEGRVIGINSRIGLKTTANMHVPVNTYRQTWDRMAKGEAWGHLEGHEPYIGVRGEADTTAAKIAHVNPGSPAEKAGLKPGDVILSFNDTSIADFASFKSAIDDRQPNEKVKLEVRRGEETLKFDVVLARKRG